MGVHKNIRDLNPLVLYTFDRNESYIDPDNNTGYSANRTEFDFPPLMIYNSGLFYKGYNLKTFQPALSEIEQNTKYQSFNTGIPQYVNMGYTNSKDNAYTFTLNNGSIYANVDLSEQIPIIKSGESYTISFQFTGTPLNGFTTNIPLIRVPDDITTLGRFGYFSYAEIVGVDNKLSQYDLTMGIGYLVDATESNNLYAEHKFGFSIDGSLTTISAWELPETPIPYPHPIYYGSTYSTAKYIDVFKFDNIILSAYRTNSNTVALYIKTIKSNINNVITYNYTRIATSVDDSIQSIFIVVTKNADNHQQVKIYTNTSTYTTTLANSNLIQSNILHVGIKSEWLKSSVKDPVYNIDLYESTSPNLSVKFDNIGIYNREITRVEALNIYYTNYNYLSIFKLFGYYQLYDFSTLYTKGATRYIEDNTTIPNMINGNTSYLYAQVNYNYMPYVVKSNAYDYEYVFKCTKHCSIMTRRNTQGWPVSMIRSSTGTLSFSFKTSDLNGILFANSLYEKNSSNIVLLMNYGYLEIWVADTLVSRISDMSNNEWHTVFITFGGTTDFYIDKTLYYTHQSELINTGAMTLFGNGLPGNTDLEVDFALIGVSYSKLDPSDMDIFTNVSKVTYSAYGQITLNNIAVGTNIFIYNRYTGALIEKLQSDSADGTFTYVNRYPYTISVIVADSTLISGKSYIVDPVEIE